MLAPISALYIEAVNQINQATQQYAALFEEMAEAATSLKEQEQARALVQTVVSTLMAENSPQTTPQKKDIRCIPRAH